MYTDQMVNSTEYRTITVSIRVEELKETKDVKAIDDLYNLLVKYVIGFSSYLIRRFRNKNAEDLLATHFKHPKDKIENYFLQNELICKLIDYDVEKFDYTNVHEMVKLEKAIDFHKQFTSGEIAIVYSNGYNIGYGISLKNECLNYHFIYDYFMKPEFGQCKIQNYFKAFIEYLNMKFNNYDALINKSRLDGKIYPLKITDYNYENNWEEIKLGEYDTQYEF